MSSKIDHQLQDLLDERRELRARVKKHQVEIGKLEVEAGKISILIMRCKRKMNRQRRVRRHVMETA